MKTITVKPFIRLHILLFGFFFLAILVASGQNQFTVFHHQSTQYKGGSQNWDVGKDDKGRIFVGTTNGVLMLDGSEPRLLEMKDKTIVRSVLCVGDRVYAGSLLEFGFWHEDEESVWSYHSLVPLMDENVFQNDEIWKIVALNDKVYFQSFGNIFVYDQQKVRVLKRPGPILFILKSGERIFSQAINGALYEIVDESLQLIEGSEIFAASEIKAILQLPDGRFVIGTSVDGLFLYDGKSFTPFETQMSDDLRKNKINVGLLLNDQMVFGTILKGIFFLDLNGHLIEHIHSGNGLQNNSVMSLLADEESNLWACLDQGFDFIWFHSPINTFTNEEIGSVYSAATYDKKLYVGTNQGVFCFEPDTNGLLTNQGVIAGSQGQVWFLKVINDELYCGLNNGTYVIKNKSLINVSGTTGAYNLKPYRLGDEEIMVQSSYNQINTFKRAQGIWIQIRSLPGFNVPSRFLELDHLGNMIVGHSITGLYLLKADPLFDSIIFSKPIGKDDGISFQTNRVFKVDNRIVVPSGQLLYQWDALTERFSPWDTINRQLNGFAAAETIIPYGVSAYWFIKKDEIGLFEIRHNQAKLMLRLIPEMYGLNMVNFWENIIALGQNRMLFCLQDGFSILDLNRLNRLKELDHPPRIKALTFLQSSGDKKESFFNDMATKVSITDRYNNIALRFALPNHAGRPAYYQFYLEGLEQNWSNWNTSTSVKYTRLPPGQYAFRVRGLTAHGMPTHESVSEFTILPPWYLSWMAYSAYIVLCIVFIILLIHNYRRRQWVKNERALKKENELMKAKSSQAEAELIKITNEKLHSEITMKNMELAKNTMSMIKKNEILIEIRNEINQQKEELGSRLPAKYFNRLNKLIDNSINSEHDWEMFEYLFDRAHENFFKRLKQEFEELTPSDFRLCAYLRMNLTSKEIAPLLNISIRGIEEKRYRLRKKLNLKSDQNLTEFIINF